MGHTRIAWLGSTVAVSVLVIGCGNARSPQSYIHGSVNRVIIQYHAGHAAAKKCTVTNPATIQGLIRAFNSLKPESPTGSKSCAAGNASANLTFISAHRRIRVRDDLPCWDVRINTSPQHLADQGQFAPVVLKVIRHRMR